MSGARGKLGTEVCRQLSADSHDVIEAEIKGSGHGEVDLLDERAVARSLRSTEAIEPAAKLGRVFVAIEVSRSLATRFVRRQSQNTSTSAFMSPRLVAATGSPPPVQHERARPSGPTV